MDISELHLLEELVRGRGLSNASEEPIQERDIFGEMPPKRCLSNAFEKHVGGTIQKNALEEECTHQIECTHCRNSLKEHVIGTNQRNASE